MIYNINLRQPVAKDNTQLLGPYFYAITKDWTQLLQGIFVKIVKGKKRDTS
jgi:hypothetical protein